jgi:hypothetical protein
MALNMGPICCPETSVRNYRYTLRNSPEEPETRITAVRPHNVRARKRLEDLVEGIRV